MLIITLVAAVFANEPVAGSERPLTVADSIEMVRLVDPGASPWAQFRFSPDGNQFLVVTVRGNLKTGLNEYTLAVFRAKDALGFVNNPERTELPKAVVRATERAGELFLEK